MLLLPRRLALLDLSELAELLGLPDLLDLLDLAWGLECLRETPSVSVDIIANGKKYTFLKYVRGAYAPTSRKCSLVLSKTHE